MRISRQLDQALARLHQALGSKMLSSAEVCADYGRDDSGLEGRVDAVVLAESPHDIESALAIAQDTGVPVTPRGGGSGRTGGAVPIDGGIVLCTRRMNSIMDLDEREGTVVVGPGVVLADLQSAVEAMGWFYPPDPNSAQMCCLGGTAAENAAGPRAFKYGATREYVLGMEAYLVTGEKFFSGRRTKKGVTGYDTTALLVGSEGTLATFGPLTLRLVPRPESVMTLLGLFPSFGAATAAVGAIVAARLVPRCIEFMDEKTLEVMRIQGNALAKEARALLLIEVDGDEDSCLLQAERVGELCDAAGAASVVVAQTAGQREVLWAARRNMSLSVRARARYKISEDVVVPRSRLSELVEEVDALGERHRIDALCYGHAGDGNLHVNFLWNDADEKLRVDVAILELFRKTVALGGTLSGEHGIGIHKAPYLRLEQSEHQIQVQERIKAAFDPRGLMNPGKIFPRPGHGPC